MDRTEYINKCQRCSMLPNGALGIKKNVPEDLMVLYRGVLYYPVSYTLSFDDNGNPRHTARLHDINAHSYINADLKEVEYNNRKEDEYAI